MKKILAIFITLFIVLLTGTLLAVNWYKNNIEANSGFEETYTITIESGESTEEILTELEENNIIKNKLATKIWLKLNPSTIQAGTFELHTYMSVEDIFLVLAKAEDETIWVTIPEGLRYDEIADIWAGKIENFDNTSFINLCEEGYNYLFYDSVHKTVEGYLYPDTYNVSPNIREQEVFDLMTETFTTKVGEIEYDELILASIVEREAIADNERVIVAGILQKRLDTTGWLLQADATLLYEYKDWTMDISSKLQTSTSEYNTYYNPDLPPTPICNPGLKSIEAAKNPNTSTPYWFYLHDTDGNIHYATTQEQHNQNIYKYLW